MDNQVVTFGLASIGVGCLAGGFWFAIWISVLVRKTKEDILATIHELHSIPIGTRLGTVESDLRALEQRQSDFEKWASQSFQSTSSATAISTRFEKAVEQIATRIEARLTRIEDYLLTHHKGETK